ncbi:hypothetical protein ACAN107058_07830 [Paracidovorax anthurii]
MAGAGAASAERSSRKTATSALSCSDCERRLAAAAALCSTSAAFCCVTWSRWFTASPTWPMPLLCSAEALAISLMRVLTCRTCATMPSMLWPALPASWLPLLTLSTLSVMRALISLAACAERCASVRTSLATTAKPRPCSPARAASTAALSARILVWKAMESITPMMSEILSEEAAISCIVSTTRPTMVPPCSAACAARAASWLASRAVSELVLTVLLSSSIEAAVSSRLLACCSVRWLRSALPMAISAAPVAMFSLPLRTWPTMFTSWPFMCCRACSSAAGSSLPWMSKVEVRSPWATAVATATPVSSGWVMERVTATASASPLSSDTAITAMNTTSARS